MSYELLILTNCPASALLLFLSSQPLTLSPSILSTYRL
jgi:uncharacterized protein (DUF2062 family)